MQYRVRVACSQETFFLNSKTEHLRTRAVDFFVAPSARCPRNVRRVDSGSGCVAATAHRRADIVDRVKVGRGERRVTRVDARGRLVHSGGFRAWID